MKNLETTQTLVESMWTLERRFPVSSWTVGGVHAWPLVRYELYNRNYHLHTRTKNPRADASFARRQLRRLASAGHDARRAVRALAEVRRSGPHDVLFYGDGVSYFRVGDTAYDRYAVPFVELARAQGLRTLIIEPHDNSPELRRALPVINVQGLVDSVELGAALRNRALAFPGGTLAGFDDAMAFFRAELAGRVTPTAAEIVRGTRSIDWVARAYEPILRLVKPKLVPMVCYYGGPRFAMALACRRLGITSIDIQHGVNGPQHWAYSQWATVPAEGFGMLTDGFWCWSRSDLDAVNSWGPSRFHWGVLGGNPILDLFLDASSKFASDFRTQLEPLLRAAAGREVVLLSLNGLETPELLARFFKNFERLADRYFFAVRTHPVRTLQLPALREHVARVKNTECELASSLPLWTVLAASSLHITEVSSTVVEAVAFGVPTVLLSHADVPLFKDEMESGWAIAIESSDSLRSGLDAQLGRKAQLRRPTQPNPGAALRDILERRRH